MFSFLKNHPFAVEAFFTRSWVVSFAVSKEQIQNLIPECLHVDTLDDRWGFIAVAMVQTKNLRPKGFSKLIGRDFFLIGYRVFVRLTTRAGKNLRGLYILKSETDKKEMELLGNIFTHYNYTTTDIHQIDENEITEIYSDRSHFRIRIENSGSENLSLPPGSPFADWKEARRFAGPLPYTFTCNAVKNKILIIEGVRKNWNPQPIKVIDWNFLFMDNLKLNNVKLANAFVIRDIPYYWKKGKLEQWKEKDFKAF